MASSRVLSPRLWSRLSPLLRTAAPVTRPVTHHSPPPDPRLLLLRPFPTPRPPGSPAALFLRHLSTVSRRHPSRSHTVNIGARARQLQNRRLWTYALTFSCVAGFIVIVLSNFQDQLVFYITPSDALQKFAANPSKNRFRLGGLVLEGSVVEPTPTSPEIEFVITDLVTDILVRFEGSLPDLFREGHSAVVEGFLRPLNESDRSAPVGSVVSEKARSGECFFKATEVLAKHDEKYMPKEVAEAIARNKKKIKAESEAKAAEKTIDKRRKITST
ncbi:CcmE [Musa troglodytarum]|uniref:CcmE n=1 Tax=Musa troglodytarum TaxID=320322 RepID=A0A9E7K3H1_9LILI|nr:CcmE [Musa troglodytarum]